MEGRLEVTLLFDDSRSGGKSDYHRQSKSLEPHVTLEGAGAESIGVSSEITEQARFPSSTSHATGSRMTQ